MQARKQGTQIVKASDARQQFSELVNKVFRRQTRVLIEKSGIPVAALISAEDLEKLGRLEAERERDFAVVDEIASAFEDVTPGKLQRQVTQAIADVRSSKRKRTAPRARSA
ncbi:MAG: type II toxin-antitoxin system Phd/YefM family antitoxin [Chloroflexota bacterium]|nr:type II toxin-antitoxin system Phd/YefM family antitoxin [Chloroflexota bacterium]